MNVTNATEAKTTQEVQHLLRTVYFVRHGVAQHNVSSHDNRQDARYIDSKLILKGQIQASRVGKLLSRELASTSSLLPETLKRIYVSPLTRCLQTASFLYQSLCEENNENAQLRLTIHPIPVLCKEELREAYGVHFSDKRIQKSKLKVRLWLASY